MALEIVEYFAIAVDTVTGDVFVILPTAEMNVAPKEVLFSCAPRCIVN